MLEGKMLDCSWKEFEELIRETIGSVFLWKIRPRDTQVNRQAVMESIERMVGKITGVFQTGEISLSSQRKQRQVLGKAGHQKDYVSLLC